MNENDNMNFNSSNIETLNTNTNNNPVSNEFNNKKMKMNRSNVVITVLLGIIIFLMLVIGYLIYTNVKNNNENGSQVVEKCSNDKSEKEEKSKENNDEKPIVYGATTDEIEDLMKLIPRIKGTDYFDFNLFKSGGIDNKDIEELKTEYDENNFYKVYSYRNRIEFTDKRIIMYFYIALCDEKENKCFRYIDNLESTLSGELTPYNSDSLKKYGILYKFTFYNSVVGYYLESVERA